MATNETAAMTEASGLADDSRIHGAAETIRGAAKEVAEELPVHEWAADTIRKLTIQAPLQSLATAFLLGAIVARRRR